MLISLWNIRRLNHPLKQKEVSSFFRASSIAFFGVLETHVKALNASRIAKAVSTHYYWWGNYDFCDDGRIWLFWDKKHVDVSIAFALSQLVHCCVKIISTKQSLVISFVYGFNLGSHRIPLWNDLTCI